MSSDFLDLKINRMDKICHFLKEERLMSSDFLDLKINRMDKICHSFKRKFGTYRKEVLLIIEISLVSRNLKFKYA